MFRYGIRPNSSSGICSDCVSKKVSLFMGCPLARSADEYSPGSSALGDRFEVLLSLLAPQPSFCYPSSYSFSNSAIAREHCSPTLQTRTAPHRWCRLHRRLPCRSYNLNGIAVAHRNRRSELGALYPAISHHQRATNSPLPSEDPHSYQPILICQLLHLYSNL